MLILYPTFLCSLELFKWIRRRVYRKQELVQECLTCHTLPEHVAGIGLTNSWYEGAVYYYTSFIFHTIQIDSIAVYRSH